MLKKIISVTLFEVTVALVVGSIILGISGALVIAAIQTAAETATEEAIGSAEEDGAPTQSLANIALSILTGDFETNRGAVKIKTKSNYVELSFKFPKPTNPNKNTKIFYTCHFGDGKLYRKVKDEDQETLLEQLTECSFATEISPDKAYITLTTDMTVNGTNDIPIILFDETTAVYENGTKIEEIPLPDDDDNDNDDDDNDNDDSDNDDKDNDKDDSDDDDNDKDDSDNDNDDSDSGSKKGKKKNK